MSVNIHPHGPKECYCPSCGYTSIVDAYIKCNTLTCPGCGGKMRSMETGEYRETPYGRSQVTKAIANNAPSMGLVILIALLVVGTGFAIIAKKAPPRV